MKSTLLSFALLAAAVAVAPAALQSPFTPQEIQAERDRLKRKPNPFGLHVGFRLVREIKPAH